MIAVLGCGPTDPDDESATTNAGTGADTGVDDGDTSVDGADTSADGADTSADGEDPSTDESTAGVDPCEPPAPGCPGGLCLGPDGTCDEVTCNQEMNYCYDPENPCRGFACGGTDRGTCSPVDGLPACTCNDGFENETLGLYCCPVDGSDPVCV